MKIAAFGDASNPLPEFGVQFNKETMQYDAWVYDNPIPGEDCKFWIDSSGNSYWWRTVNMRPQHMEVIYAVEKKNLPIDLVQAGEWSDQRDVNGVEGSMGYPVLHTLDEADPNEVEQVRLAFPDLDYVVNYNRWMQLNEVKTADWDDEPSWEDFEADVANDFNFVIHPSGEIDYFGEDEFHDGYITSSSDIRGVATEGDIFFMPSGKDFDEVNGFVLQPGHVSAIQEVINDNPEMYVDLSFPDLEANGDGPTVLQRLNGLAKAAQNLNNLPPTFDSRGLFDLQKYVGLRGEQINWDAFRQSSTSPDEDLQSLLEVLTEVGVARNADKNAIGGMFIVDAQKLENLLQASNDARQGESTRKAPEAVRRAHKGLRKDSADLYDLSKTVPSDRLELSPSPVSDEDRFLITTEGDFFWPSNLGFHASALQQLFDDGVLSDQAELDCSGQDLGQFADYVICYSVEDQPTEEIYNRMKGHYPNKSVSWNGEIVDPRNVHTSALEDFYPLAGEYVDGLFVREDIPNTDSISGWFDFYEALPGIREVPMGEGFGMYASADDNERVRALAAAIEQSGEINPLIVGMDQTGDDSLHIIEGGHRASALTLLGKQSFPALVVINKTKPNESGFKEGDRVLITELDTEVTIKKVDSFDDGDVAFYVRADDGRGAWLEANQMEPVNMNTNVLEASSYNSGINVTNQKGRDNEESYSSKSQDGSSNDEGSEVQYQEGKEDFGYTGDASKISLLHFQKFAERSDVEIKADQIFSQGGVEFVVATPDPERNATLWEFNVTSTSGQQYPLYGDTAVDNPTKWIDWFDVACSCDWGRWNYDRAPEYRHLERFPCSHAMATEKWLNQNGQREQDRANREMETGQQEIRFDQDPEKGRRPRPGDVYRQQMGQPVTPPAPAQQAPATQPSLMGQPPAPAGQPAQQGVPPAPQGMPPGAEAVPPPPPEPQAPVPVFRDQVLRPREPLESKLAVINWEVDPSEVELSPEPIPDLTNKFLSLDGEIWYWDANGIYGLHHIEVLTYMGYIDEDGDVIEEAFNHDIIGGTANLSYQRDNEFNLAPWHMEAFDLVSGGNARVPEEILQMNPLENK